VAATVHPGVVTRRETLLDAAITLVGGGAHALNHRNVDAATGLPTGSASNHFRSRDVLLDAVVERSAARYAILVEAGFGRRCGLSSRPHRRAAQRLVHEWAARLRLHRSRTRRATTMNHWTGIVLHQLAIPDPVFDPSEPILALVTSVIRTRPPEAPA
jgi:AcrR family transcriptional regulator